MRVEFSLKGERLGQVLRLFGDWFPESLDNLKHLYAGKWGVKVTFKRMAPRHSDEQRGYYWRSLHAFGKACGYSRAEVENNLHPVMCAATWGESHTRTFTARVVDTETGEIVEKTYSWPVPNETSSKDADGDPRNRESYSELIETLIRVAGDMGYSVPPPERKAA